MRMLSALVVFINGVEGGVLLGVEDGGAHRHVPLPKLPLNGVCLNSSSVGGGVELPLALFYHVSTLVKYRIGTGK